jgi:hypothetical protein
MIHGNGDDESFVRAVPDPSSPPPVAGVVLGPALGDALSSGLGVGADSAPEVAYFGPSIVSPATARSMVSGTPPDTDRRLD